MEGKTLSVKDLITIIGIVLSLAGTYFALKNEVQSAQLKTEAAIRELDLVRANDQKIFEIKLQALQLEVAALKADLRKK